MTRQRNFLVLAWAIGLVWTMTAVLAAAGPACEDGPCPGCAGKTTLTSAAAEWTDLFNGKDLTGWTTTGNWYAEDGGVLSITPRPGERGWQRYSAYLYTDKQYGDFILDLEYKHPPRGNSGVFFRIADQKDPVNKGMEVQILDSYGKKGKLGHHDCAGIINVGGASKNMCKPAGEWNRMVITCKGTKVTVEHNGEVVNEVDLAETARKDHPLTGYIALQDHGLPLSFRNIRIMELDGDSPANSEWVSLFDGKTLTGWTQKNGKATYHVEDGTIVGVTAKGSPNSFLCTEKEYGDFELTFEVKVDNRLNSGVQLRSRSLPEYKNGRVHGPQVEIEAAPGESGHFYSEGTGRGWLSPAEHRNDPEKRNAFKNNQWNHYRVVAKGPRLQSWVNGIPVGDITDEKSSQTGFIGLQVHGVGNNGPFEVAWRNINIRELK